MSRLSRVERLLARVEQALGEGARTLAMVQRYEVGQLLRETVPVDDLIELSREVHAGDTDAETRLLDLVADAEARWRAGERPGGDRGARELIERETNATRRRLGDLRH